MHRYSVFTNSCLNVPLDPVSKMPKTAYERDDNVVAEQCSVDSSSTCSIIVNNCNVEKLKDFYKSIPEYNDINHLSETDFYFTLKRLRDKKRLMLGIAVENANDVFLDCKNIASDLRNFSDVKVSDIEKVSSKPRSKLKNRKNGMEVPIKRYDQKWTTNEDSIKRKGNNDQDNNSSLNIKGVTKLERPKRNHSACSISWQDGVVENKNEIDKKFDKFFDADASLDDMYKTQSMPSSPLRTRKIDIREQKALTIPKPFKMTERDEQNRMLTELRGLRKSFSEDMLHQKRSRKQFKANPVPIESRIPLYDKILEDQAMRYLIPNNIDADPLSEARHLYDEHGCLYFIT